MEFCKCRSRSWALDVPFGLVCKGTACNINSVGWLLLHSSIKVTVFRYIKTLKIIGMDIEKTGDYFFPDMFCFGLFLEWKIFMSTASCTCSSLPGVILQILRGFLSESATQSLVSSSAFAHVCVTEWLISCLVWSSDQDRCGWSAPLLSNK